ncbi:MAG: tyrosine-type recombinase/integrase [Acidimicrobiales bacterium]
MTDALAYWSVVADDWCPVPAADSFLRHLRIGADRAEGTTRSYAGDLALFFGWCEKTGRDLGEGLRAMGSFVGWLRTTPVERQGAGVGKARSAGRINHVLAAVRELAKHAVATGTLDGSILALLYEVADDRHLPADLRPEGAGLRYVARPRHRQRERGNARPAAVRQEEAEALLRVARSWRDRFLVVLLWFCGLRIGEALGLRRSDLHLVDAALAMGCGVGGPHLHVVRRDNPNQAMAKTGGRAVPVRTEMLACYDRYLAERERCPAAEACDFVLVNLFHEPLGRPMSADAVRAQMAESSRRAGLSRVLRPHMFRHATAGELLARGAGLDVVRELLGHASIRSTEVYLHPDADRLRDAVERLGPLGFGEQR